MSKKRPHASEGHLHLPRGLGPVRARPPVAAPEAGPAGSAPGGARLRPAGPGAHVDEGDAWTAHVLDDALAGFDVRRGDRVVLVRGRFPEYGDLVAYADGSGGERVRLWRAFPDAGSLRLCDGVHARTLPAAAAVAGVLVAQIRSTSRTPSGPTCPGASCSGRRP